MGKPFVQSGGGRNPDLLITTINLRLNQAGPDQSNVYDKIAFVADGGGAIESYPMTVASQKEENKGDTEDRDWNSAVVWTFPCSSNRIEPPGQLFSISESRDPYGILMQSGPVLVNYAQRVWDRQLAQMIGNNPTSFDTLSLFNTAHPANPNNPDLRTYTNDLAAAGTNDIDVAGITAAMEALGNIPGADGNLLNADLGIPLCLCPTVPLYVKARLLAFGTLGAAFNNTNAALATAAASQSNPVQGMFTPVYYPELLQNGAGAGANAAKYWYLCRTNALQKFAIVRRTRLPQMRITDANGHLAETKNARGIYWWCEGGAAPGVPGLAVRMLAP